MKALTSLLLSAWMLVLSGCAQAQTQVVTTTDPIFSRAELDQVLAPIALYPDTVLSHILIAATYPLEVIEAERWTRANPHLEAEDAVNAAMLEGWDPSVAALTAFPDLLGRMSDDVKWLQNLGDVFLADEARVMDAIQNLREKAYTSGSLKKMKHVKVQREKQIIVIEPAVERVVYVPYYDTRTVYGSWWWDSYPPVYWRAPATYVHVGGVYWGPRVYLGNSFFFSSVHWPQRRIVVIDYRHQHHRHPHFYSGRNIAHYQGARRWEHNPVHRRNIVYRSEPVRQRYTNPQAPRRFSREWRDNRSEQRRDIPAANRDRRNDGQPRHSATRERLSEGRRFERSEQGPERNREQVSPERTRSQERIHRPQGQDSRPQEQNSRRAEDLRERLERNRATTSPRGGEPQAERRNRETPAVTRRDDAAPRERAEQQSQRERPQPAQLQNTQSDRQAERRERVQSQQETRRETPSRRVETPTRPERTQPQRSQQREQRHAEPSRSSQRERPRQERTERRFERP